MSDTARADHRHHGPGRLVPGRAPARQGLRGLRHGPARRRPRTSSGSRTSIDRITLVQGDLLDQCLARRRRSRTRGRPRSTTSPRRASSRPRWKQPVLTAEFTALGVTRMLEAIRRVDPGDPLLPGVVVGDVRQGARGPADRADAVLPAVALRRGQGRTATSSPSTTASRTACSRSRGSSSTTSRPRRGLEFVTRKITRRRRAHQARPRRRAAAGQPRREARLGLRRRLRAGDVAHAPAGRGRDDYVIATGETHSVQEFVGSRVRARRPRSRAGTSSSIQQFLRPAEVDHLVGDASKARRAARLGADGLVPGARRDDGRRGPGATVE